MVRSVLILATLVVCGLAAGYAEPNIHPKPVKAEKAKDKDKHRVPVPVPDSDPSTALLLTVGAGAAMIGALAIGRRNNPAPGD